jgi:lipoyl(octanoyl) transferase
VIFETRLSWPYDDALREMNDARDRVIAGGRPVVFVGEHDREVVTLGRHAPESQLVMRDVLERRGVVIRRVERGGGATAHGPGQLVVYPVLHLERARLDVRSLTCALLEAARDTAQEIAGITRAEVRTEAGGAGVFVDGAKLASVGFRVERGVVTHGLSLNVDNDLALFGLIAPCGVSSQAMASLRTHGDSVAPVPRTLDQVAERLGFHVARRCVLG